MIDLRLRYHVYVDWIVIDNRIFFIYVGKGDINRCNEERRNAKHDHLFKTYSGKRAIVASFFDEAKALQRERRLIDVYDTFVDSSMNEEYACNFTTGGEGYSVANESRELISRRTREAMDNPELRKLISERTVAAQRRPETWKKMKDNQKIAVNTEAYRAKMKKIQHNRWWQPKITQTIREKMKDPEARRRVSEWTKAAMTPEVCRIVSERTKLAMRAASGNDIEQVSQRGEVVGRFKSAREATALTGIVGKIAACCRGEVDSVGGFSWRYVPRS